MAYNNTRAYLGYEDEYITEKHKGIVNFITNKVGGKPVSRACIIFICTD